MELAQKVRNHAIGWYGRISGMRQVGAASVALVVLATTVATQVVVADCAKNDNGFGVSKNVPCQAATCVTWSSAIGTAAPACTNPANGGNVAAVSVKVTATAWSFCTVAASPGSGQNTPCTESMQSCATYTYYLDTGCATTCTTIANPPQYCNGPPPPKS